MKKVRTNALKNVSLSAVFMLVASAGPANAEAWKTMHTRENNREQIDLQSITRQEDYVFANSRQLSNNNNVFSTTELEMDCEGKISTETTFIPSETPDYRTRESIHFMQENGEWWDIFDVERGSRSCTLFSCKLLDKEAMDKEGDKRLGKYYDLLCRD